MDILAQAAEIRFKEGQVTERDEGQGYSDPASLASHCQGPHRPSPTLLPPGLSYATNPNPFQINPDHSQPSINPYTPHNYFAPSTTSHYYNYPVNQHTPSSVLNIHLSSPSRNQSSNLNLHIHSPSRNSNFNAALDLPSNSMSFEDFRPPSPTPLSPLNNVSTSQTFSNARPRSRSRSFTWSITPRHKRRYSSSSPSPTRQPAQPSKKAAQPSKRASPASKRAKSFRKDTQDDEIVFTSMGPVVKGGGDSNKNWPAAKKSIVFDFILGVNADDRFNLFKKAPGKIFAKAAPLTGKTATQCQSMFQRARQLYNRIHAFLRVTGGGGDGDEDKIDDNFDFDDDDKIAELLDKAKANGKDVAGINAKLLREWKEHGWLDLFESRYGKNPKTERNYALSSAMPISPAKSIKELEVEEEPATPVIKTEPTNAAQVVAERRFTPAQRIRNSSQDLMGGINDYFRTRAQVDEGVAQRKEKRFEYKQFKDHVEWAQNLLKDDTISTEQRTRLHKIILDALEA